MLKLSRRRYRPRRYYVHNFRYRLGQIFRIIVIVGLITVLVYGGLSLRQWLLTGERFGLREIVVKGTGQLTVSQVLSQVPWRVGDNIFRCNLSEVRQNLLKSFPRIKKVSIRRSYPNKIVIKVREREPIGRVLEANNLASCLGIDKEGVCFELLAQELLAYENGPFLRIDRPGAMTALRPLLEFTNELKKMYNNIWKNIYTLDMNTYGEITTVSKDGVKICWGKYLSREDLSAKVRAIENIQEKSIARGQKIEYLDLNLFGLGRIIVRPAEKAGES